MFTRNTYRTVSVLAALTATSALHAATIKVPAHQPTIGAAISAASMGDKIVVYEGVYFEDLALGLKTGLTIEGKGDVIVDAGGASYAISLALCTDVSVEGLTFRNASTALGRISFGSRNRFEDCTFKGGAGDGVLIQGGAEHEIVDCLFQNVPLTGARVTADTSYIANSKFVNCGQFLGEAAIQLVGGYLTAESNEILDDGIGLGVVVGLNGQVTHHALVLDNEITGAGIDGIFMDDATDCLIMDNVIKDSGDDGVDLNVGADHNTLHGNMIVASGGTGMEISTDMNSALKNRVKNSVGSGVVIYASAEDSFWFKNKVKKSGVNGFLVMGAGHAFSKNVAAGSINLDLVDDAGLFANDYFDNKFGTTNN